MPILSRATTIKEGFRTCSNKGFHIKFTNGWIVSVQFGQHNHCENYDLDIEGDYLKFVLNPPDMESKDAEVWCFRGEEHYPENPLDYQSAKDVLRILNKVSKFK